jgi:predicted flavoprotein YhiN
MSFIEKLSHDGVVSRPVNSGDMALCSNKGSGADASRRSKTKGRRLVSAAGGISTHSTGADGAWLSSARLNARLDTSRPVNSGVRFLLNGSAQILNQMS